MKNDIQNSGLFFNIKESASPIKNISGNEQNVRRFLVNMFNCIKEDILSKNMEKITINRKSAEIPPKLFKF